MVGRRGAHMQQRDRGHPRLQEQIGPQGVRGESLERMLLLSGRIELLAEAQPRKLLSPGITPLPWRVCPQAVGQANSDG